MRLARVFSWKRWFPVAGALVAGTCVTVSAVHAQAVPHGEIRVVRYMSPTYHAGRRMHVYLPHGYARGMAYPVLYLTHGAGQDDSTWTDSTIRAQDILDRLIAGGQARPMIVVMPLSGGADPRLQLASAGKTPAQLAAIVLTPHQLAARARNAVAARDTFLADLTGTIVPYVDGHFRTVRGRSGRAIAGASFGGSEVIIAATRHLDTFAWFGAFGMGIEGGGAALANPVSGSGMPDTPDQFLAHNRAFFADPARTNAALRLFFIGVGRDDGVVRDGPEHLSQTLSAHGIANHFVTIDGGHSEASWASLLTACVPLLFQHDR